MGKLVVAVMTVVPAVNPVIRKFAPPEFGAIVMVEGNNSTAGLLDVSVTGTPPAGAITESVTCMERETPASTVTFCCAKFIAAPIVAMPVPLPKPTAVAVMVAEPKLTPLKVGGTEGCVCPVSTVTEAGTVALLVSLLDSAIVVLVTAGAGSEMLKPTDPPGATVTLDTRMAPEFWIVMLEEAEVTPVAEAVITAEPGTKPATGTCAVVAPPAIRTVAGTLATAPLLEPSVTVNPPAGAAPERVNSKFCDEPLGKARVPGVNEKVAVTVTACVAVE